MHELFADWYRTADPLATRETIEKRWQATAEILDAISKAQVATLAAFVTRPGADTPEWLRGPYKSSDAAMATRGIEEEMRVLAAIVLRLALEKAAEDHSVSVTAGLSLLAGAFGMPSQPNWLAEHLRAAADQLSRTGRSLRESSAPLSIGSPVEPAEVNAALGDVRRVVAALSETTNCLWWAFSRHSRLLNHRYDGLKAPVAAMVAPADLFAFICAVPVTAEVESLLLHVLMQTASAGNGELSLKNYFTGLGRDNAARLMKTIPVPCRVLCPIHWGIERVAAGGSWQTEFQQLFGFRLTAKFATPAIAIQCLRELCLARTYAEEA